MKFLLSILFFFPLFLTGQTVTVSDPVSIRNDQYYQILGKMKDRFLIFRDQTNFDYEVQAFDKELKATWNKELELDKKRAEILGVLAAEDHFNIVYRFKQKGEYLVKVRRYDAGANMVDSATVYNYGSRFYPPKLQLVESEDRSKILLYHIERQSTIEAISFDVEEMKMLWRCQFSPDVLPFGSDYQQAILTNQGELFFVIGRDNRKSEKENHAYEIYIGKSYPSSKSVNLFSIPMQEHLTYDAYFTYDNLNNQIIAAGLYSDRSRGKATGYFYMRIPRKSPNSYTLHFHPFDDKIVSTYNGKKVKDNKGISETSIQEVVLRRDGGILLIAERNKLFERQLTTAGRGYIGADGRRYIVDYQMEDLLALSIHPDGALHWQNVLPKRQYSQDDDAMFSSFFLFKTPSSLRVLFNDEIKYENTVSEYVIKGDGKLDRNSVLSTENQKLRLRFRDALQVGPQELLVPSERRNKLQLVHINYRP